MNILNRNRVWRLEGGCITYSKPLVFPPENRLKLATEYGRIVDLFTDSGDLIVQTENSVLRVTLQDDGVFLVRKVCDA